MTRSETEKRLKDVIKLANPDLATVIDGAEETSSLIGDMGLSSVDMLVIVVAVEETFGVSFEDVNIGDFKTVGDVIDYIEANAL